MTWKKLFISILIAIITLLSISLIIGICNFATKGNPNISCFDIFYEQIVRDFSIEIDDDQNFPPSIK